MERAHAPLPRLFSELPHAPLPRTPLPWYAVNAANPTDQFFTKREIAQHCLNTFYRVARDNGFDLAPYTFIEPSAGAGCFMDLLPTKHVALDIDPCREGVQRQDFLEWSPRSSLGKVAVVGNPPFGVRGAIALAFLNRAAHFADLVGFILPMTFASDGKGGAMTRVKGLTLLHSEELPPNSFHTPNGIDRDINTLWQVWGKGVCHKLAPVKTCKTYVDIFTACTAPSRRCGMTKMHLADVFIQSTFYKPPIQVVQTFDEVKYGSGYGIIVKKKRRQILNVLQKTDWVRYSSRATNHCKHIRIRQIMNAIIDGGYHD